MKELQKKRQQQNDKRFDVYMYHEMIRHINETKKCWCVDEQNTSPLLLLYSVSSCRLSCQINSTSP
jgi:D-serine dehydratase